MKKLLSFVLITAGLAGALPALALQVGDYPVFFNIRAGMTLTELVSAIFNFILLAGGAAGVVAVIWGGINYLTSAGDPTKMGDARNQVFAAILGLIILFSSWIILNTINPDLVNIREPGSLPAPAIIQPPETPVGPPPETPAGFSYVPLGKTIDDVISQEEETIPLMRQFASLMAQCSIDLCEGGECEYQEEVCTPVCTLVITTHGPEEACAVICQMVTKTCSSDCNTGDPCSSNRAQSVAQTEEAADKMEEELTKLRQAKNELTACVAEEETLLLSCQEGLDFFGPGPSKQWDIVNNCRQGYDFYCAYGQDEDAELDEITLPFDTIEESMTAVRELNNILANCNCAACQFCCQCCAACSGTPCPGAAYSAAANAMDAVGVLETRLNSLKEAIDEVSLFSAADEFTTLTCSEAHSWLRLVKGSGCPGVNVFACCPIDSETEDLINYCQPSDFFFCTAP
jgi:hypothetical protein